MEAAIGLYGLIAFSVTQRTREMGIRIALGARAREVVTMVLKEGIGLVATGLVVGLLIAALGARFLSRLLIDVSPTDPVTYATVALLLFGVTVFAAIIPPAVRRKPIPWRRSGTSRLESRGSIITPSTGEPYKSYKGYTSLST